MKRREYDEEPGNNYSTDIILQAIHECVYGSTIRHVLKLSTEILVLYLSTFPFYRGADTLYYFLLGKAGRDAYYAPDGRHLVTIHPELIGVYVLAEQDIRAVEILNADPNNTIYSRIKANITRTMTCHRYQMRHSIIIGEAPVGTAMAIPSIALNIPVYQSVYQILSPQYQTILIENDCWECIQSLHVYQGKPMALMIRRMAVVKGTMLNLWNVILKEYYGKQLLRLKIHDYLPELPTKHITMLSNLFPEIIRLPPHLDAIGIRIWFSSKPSRAYLLGYDLEDGIPCDRMISERLQHMQKVGIEQYSDEITGVIVDELGFLTGKIGMLMYPQLIGKKLMNNKDMVGVSIGVYYPFDLCHFICGNNAYIIPTMDIAAIAINDNVDIDVEYLSTILTEEKIPYLTEVPSKSDLRRILRQYLREVGIPRGTPVRNKLVETMSYDLLNF
jgi:hypothetical protein